MKRSNKKGPGLVQGHFLHMQMVCFQYVALVSGNNTVIHDRIKEIPPNITGKKMIAIKTYGF